MDREGARFVASHVDRGAQVRLPQRRKLLPVVLHVAVQIDLAAVVRHRDRALRVAAQHVARHLQFIELDLLGVELIFARGGQGKLLLLIRHRRSSGRGRRADHGRLSIVPSTCAVTPPDSNFRSARPVTCPARSQVTGA